MGFKKTLGRGAAAVATGGGSEAFRALGGSGSFKDLLFGKKGGALAADPLGKDILALRGKAIKGLSADFDKPDTALVGAQTARGVRGLVGQRAASRRRIGELTARQGLQGTSAGLTQQVGVDRDTNRRISELRASAPERLRELRLGKISRALQATSGAPVRFRPRAAQRGGGISGILGAGIGGALGGGAGAQAGLGAGQAAGGVFG